MLLDLPAHLRQTRAAWSARRQPGHDLLDLALGAPPLKLNESHEGDNQEEPTDCCPNDYFAETFHAQVER
jgi:hypothetical protein